VEYGARAGTTTIWWTGSEKETLAEAGNISDSYTMAHGSPDHFEFEPDLDDGNTVHARVGSYRANAFGLHDVIGNLMEWCLDGFHEDFYRRETERDPVADPETFYSRVVRGGGYVGDASYARSAVRVVLAPSVADGIVGVRPVRRIAP
jgi:formylglycine-generating enzyme required for sulfatase activity